MLFVIVVMMIALAPNSPPTPSRDLKLSEKIERAIGQAGLTCAVQTVNTGRRTAADTATVYSVQCADGRVLLVTAHDDGRWDVLVVIDWRDGA